jgi:hypothetical protein
MTIRSSGIVDVANQLHTGGLGSISNIWYSLALYQPTAGRGSALYLLAADSGDTASDGAEIWLEPGTSPELVIANREGDDIEFRTPATNTRLVIKDDGDIGIGTTNPGYKLDVVGNRIRLRTGTKSITLRTDGAETDLEATNGDLFIRSTTGDTIIQPWGGRVGVGTASPVTLVDVDSSTSSDGYAIDGMKALGGYSGNVLLRINPDGDFTGGIYIDEEPLYVPAGLRVGGYSTTSPDPDELLVDGACGIRTTSPVGALDVRGDEVRIWTGTGTNNYATLAGELYVQGQLEVDSTINTPATYSYPVVTGRDVRITSIGWLGTSTSSERYKENIAPLEDDFLKILKAQPVTYTCKETKEPGIGFIAEDLDEIGLHHLVFYDTEGRPDGIRYDAVSLYLLEIIKTQNEEINNQQQQIEELKNEIDEIKELLNMNE